MPTEPLTDPKIADPAAVKPADPRPIAGAGKEAPGKTAQNPAGGAPVTPPNPGGKAGEELVKTGARPGISAETQFTILDGEITVKSVTPGALENGGALKAGDQIIAADGKRLHGLPPPDAFRAISAAKHLTVGRGDSVIEVEPNSGKGSAMPAPPKRVAEGQPTGGNPGALLTGWRSTPRGAAKVEKDDTGYIVSIPAGMMGEHEAWKQEKLTGDFDIVLAYILDDWKPSKNDSLLIEIRLSAKPDMQAEPVVRAGRRVANGGDSVLFAKLDSKEKTASEMSDFGQLRLQRKGGVVRVLIEGQGGEQWKDLHSAPSLPADLYLGVLIQRTGESPLVIQIDSVNVE